MINSFGKQDRQDARLVYVRQNRKLTFGEQWYFYSRVDQNNPKMPLKMGSITKALATGLVLKKEHTDDKKVKENMGI